MACSVGHRSPRRGSREFLIRTVAYGIQAQAFGGLDGKKLQLLQGQPIGWGTTEASEEPAWQGLEAFPRVEESSGFATGFSDDDRNQALWSDSLSKLLKRSTSSGPHINISVSRADA